MPLVKLRQNSLLVRLVIFCTSYIIVSGLIASWVVTSRLLEDFYFSIYTNIGKLLLFSIIIFGILIRKEISDLERLPKAKTNLVSLLFSLILIPIFFILGSTLLEGEFFGTNIVLSLASHIVLMAIPILLLFGVFGFEFLVGFYRRFKREISLCLLISAIFDVAIFQVWKLWPFFSSGVLLAVSFLLSFTSRVQFFPPRTLLVEDFAVSVEQACSGLDSLLLFSSLYILIAVLDWKFFNKTKLAIMFVVAAIGLYIVNIARVYTLIVIGAYVSKELSIKLFHTYLGMVFFIIFFFAFWKLSYSWMRR